ncbi:NAD-P-binding protein [Mycena alexandri]|uniref:NAD-P-binding protein n=1 Tax=Mycena alexandri TaxID=1745969 RepID=A0AAD6X4F9_9AGAR|nr:NAD-P-binding protein [Mycena alexandri]KAJ7036337.1 NAD-P-binding protein [Mycena alexandri]
MGKKEELVDLHGKVVLITGGNTGIGYATIQILARRGAKVYMATRDATKAKAAIKKMEAEGLGEGSVHFLELDLSDPRAVSRAAKQFAESEQRLDILINNAALGLGPFHLTDDGILDVMVINHVSPFILTDTLLPLLKRTAAETDSDVRIVNLSSSMHAQVKPTTFATKETLAKDYGPSAIKQMDTYSYTKLANVLHAKALQKRLDSEKSNITCISIHPGVVHTQTSTSVMGSVPFLGPFLKRVVVPLVFGTWDAGGKAVAFAAASKDVVARRSKYKGAYLSVSSLTEPSKQAQDPKLQNELYETTEKVVREMQV